ncbi:MAG: hypothetical protein ACR2IH_10800 [Pyrinomonadaceae bacterium]
MIAPFTPAEGVLTLRRDGIVKTERFTMKDSSVTLKIPIEEKHLPNIYAQVDLVGTVPPTDDKGIVDPKLSSRPAFASGSLDLAVSTESRKLTVVSEPRDPTLPPGGETKLDVSVKDSRGEPVSDTEVAVVVVDESVLALSRYRIDDPLEFFYSLRGPGVQDYHLRKNVLLGNPGDIKAPPPAPPASVGASVEVSSDSVSQRQVGGLPINGRSFSSLLKIAPNVRPEPLAAGFQVDGASGAENEFFASTEQSYRRTVLLSSSGSTSTRLLSSLHR